MTVAEAIRCLRRLIDDEKRRANYLRRGSRPQLVEAWDIDREIEAMQTLIDHAEPRAVHAADVKLLLDAYRQMHADIDAMRKRTETAERDLAALAKATP